MANTSGKPSAASTSMLPIRRASATALVPLAHFAADLGDDGDDP
jgi:hypothetical protein